MAVDLLGNPTDVHRYRRDLESTFYVTVYVTLRYHEGHEINDPYYKIGKNSDKSR
jgi:hypothetical protein